MKTISSHTLTWPCGEWSSEGSLYEASYGKPWYLEKTAHPQNIRGSKESKKNLKIEKSGTFKKFGGTRKLWKIMIFEKTGLMKKIAPTLKSNETSITLIMILIIMMIIRIKTIKNHAI